MHKTKFSSLLKKLGHRDASKRRAAAEALAEGDERAVYPLIKALRDGNYGVQDAAINSLMKIRKEVTAYLVLPLLREEAFLRNTAMIILREMGQIAVPLFPILLKDKDDDIRKFTLDIIHDIQYCNYPEKVVEMLENDPNPNVRAAAAKTLGALNYKDAVPQLVKALNDEEWVCFSVLEALTEMKEEKAVDPIISLLNNPSEAVRLAAIEALGKLGSQKAHQPLVEHIARSGDFEKQVTLLNLVRLGTIPPMPNVSDDLMNILINSDWDDKFIAIKGLLMLKEDRAIYHMIDIAGSIDFAAPDREEKVQAFKEIVSSFGCSDALLKILQDDSMKYRGKSLAIEIAGELKCSSAVKSLITLLKSNYRDVRRSSIYSLGQIESEEATEHLIDAINDHDSHVRKSAVIALGKIGEMSAFEPLMKMLQKEIYQDVINEFIMSLLKINATLFLSRIGEFNEPLRTIAAEHAAAYQPEVSC
jgi:HEAT repeat protein